MSQVVFTVRSGSSDELYQLEASRTDRGIRFTCTCPAGRTGSHCKHRLSILLNDTSSCVDVDAEAVAELQSMAEGSELVDLLREMNEAERAVVEAQANLKRAKKAVGKALAG